MARGLCSLICCSRPTHRRLGGFLVLSVIILISYSFITYVNLQKSHQSFQQSMSSTIHRLPPHIHVHVASQKTGDEVKVQLPGQSDKNSHFAEESKVALEVVTSPPAIAHSLFDLETLPRVMSCQQPAAKDLVVAKQEKIHDMTIKVCRRFCTNSGVPYGALYNGDSCYCMYQHGTSWLQKDSQCNIPCTGDNSTMCGGKDTWLFFKADEMDGHRSWTIWTSYGKEPSAQNILRVRYRGCTGDRHAKRECVVEREAKITNNPPANISDIQHYFVGCYTHQTWSEPDLQFVISKTNSSKPDMDCIKECRDKGANYAVYVLPGECVCTKSLGWSRPVDSCISQFGALVFSTQSLEKEQLTLRFESRKTKKNIAVVAHYRAGSSFASIMFSEYPGAVYVFEPASVFGVAWPGVNMSLANEAERSKIFLERIYPLWFECRAMDLPGVWLGRYPNWGDLNTGLEVYRQCKDRVKARGAPFLCSPYIEEKCLMAPIVAAKTTRMIHAENIRAFSKLGTNIEVVHAFRDPRGTLQSRAKLEKWYRTNQTRHLEVACWELNELRKVFEAPDRPPTLHVLHYEDLATDVISAATNIYKKMGLVVPEKVIKVLEKATGKDGSRRANAYDIVQRDPESRINSWASTMNHTVVEMGDESTQCQQFFKSYPEHYKPLKAMNTKGKT